MAFHAYYPFGREITGIGQDDLPLKFTGHERDVNGTGARGDLDYMHARFCSPFLGRFLSPDLVLGSPEVPQGWDRYSYVMGNPVNYTDPYGLFPGPGGIPVFPPTGMTIYDIGFAQTITVIGSFATVSYSSTLGAVIIQNPTGSLLGSISFASREDGPDKLSLFERILSEIPIDGKRYGDCIRKNRLDPRAAWIALGSAVPKRLVPPFRVPYRSDPLTNPIRVVGHYLKPLSPSTASALRTGGRVVSRAATPLTIAEGLYDWLVIVGCAF